MLGSLYGLLCQRDRKFLGIRQSALVESVILFSLLTVFSSVAGVSYFDSYLHPYWIVLLLIVIQYGLVEALACAILASGFYLIFSSVPKQGITETLYEYFTHVTMLPIMWLVVAAITGGIRQRQINVKNNLANELSAALGREKAIADQYSLLKAAKEHLERRIAEEQASLASLTHIAEAFESFDEGTIYEGFRKMIAMVIRPDKFSFFTVNRDANKHGLICAFTQGWVGESYAQYIPGCAPLYQRVVERKETLNVMLEQDENDLAKEGMLALPVSDPRHGCVIGVLKIEKLPFAHLHPHRIERLKFLCQWAAMALVNAKMHLRKYKKAIIAPAKVVLLTQVTAKGIPTVTANSAELAHAAH